MSDAKRGRPVADPSGKQQTAQVRLAPAEKAWLVATYGSVNAGLRALVLAGMRQLHQPALKRPPV